MGIINLVWEPWPQCKVIRGYFNDLFANWMFSTQIVKPDRFGPRLPPMPNLATIAMAANQAPIARKRVYNSS